MKFQSNRKKPVSKRQALIKAVDAQHGIHPNASGKNMFWVPGCGCLSSEDLRWIADELDKRNQPKES